MINYPNPNTVPTEVKNTALKYAYTYALQEALRIRHNEVGASYSDGEITKQEWEHFLNEWFTPRRQVITDALLALREEVKGYVVLFEGKIDLEGIL